MKNLIVIIALSVFSFGINNSLQAQSKKMDEFTVKVDGLGCPFCAYGLEKKFKELKGIKEVKIELEKGMLDFQYPSTKELSIADVESQVEKAGYTPVSVSIKRASGKVEKSASKEASSITASEVKDLSFFVAGNCGMCKARIEKAALKVEGVESADWNKKTKQLTVKAASNVPQADIEKSIAKSGHDTKSIKAKKSTYEDLPGCCKYERIK